MAKTRAYVRPITRDATTTCACGHAGQDHKVGKGRSQYTFCLRIINRSIEPTSQSRWCPCPQFEARPKGAARG